MILMWHHPKYYKEMEKKRKQLEKEREQESEQANKLANERASRRERGAPSRTKQSEQAAGREADAHQGKWEPTRKGAECGEGETDRRTGAGGARGAG